MYNHKRYQTQVSGKLYGFRHQSAMLNILKLSMETKLSITNSSNSMSYMQESAKKNILNDSSMSDIRSLPRQLPSIKDGQSRQQKRQPFTKSKPPNTS